MKIKSLLFASLTAAFFASSAVFGGEPCWIFNHGEDLERAECNQGNVLDEFGLLKIRSTGTDCTFTVRMTEDDKFSADERPYFAVRYKYESQIDVAGLFYTTDELTTLSDKSFSAFDVKPDGKWHNAVVDMRQFPEKSWKGTITSFRFDPTNPSDSDSTYSLSRMGFFPSEEAAVEFLEAANDEADYGFATTIVENGSRCFIPGGVLDDSFDRADFVLKNAPELGKAEFKGTRDEVVVVNGSKIEALCDVTSRGFATYCVCKGGDLRLQDAALTGDVDFSGRASESSIRFVVARQLMSAERGKFRPEAKLTKAEQSKIAKALKEYEGYGDPGKALVGLIDKLNGLTREECAVLVAKTIRDELHTNVESEYSREYYTRDRIRVGAWGNFRALDFDEDYMKTYADCGFDFLLPFVGTTSVNLLNLANKYGVEVYVNDGSYAQPLVGDAEYCDFPNYTGCYVTDEPGSDAYDKLAAKCNPYMEATGLQAYVNLLPMYANAAQLKYGAGAAAIEYYDADPDLFKKYCEGFCQKFNTKYICTDIYPFNWTKEHKKSTYGDYTESINVIASVAREYDREFWCYIQTFAWIASKRTPNEPEFRWQCYSMLSFGCKCLLCWTYAGYEDEFPSLVDTKSRKTPAWYAAKPVMWEMRAISDEYVKYRNVGAFTHNCSDDTPYLKMSNEYKDFDAIQEIDCAQPLLVGCFEKKDGEGKAFTIVNMAEFEEVAGATVRVKLQGESVTSWRRGKPVEVKPDADGYYTFELESGDGVFVTVKRRSSSAAARF